MTFSFFIQTLSFISFLLYDQIYCKNIDADLNKDYANSKIKSTYVLIISCCVLIVAASLIAFLMFSKLNS